MKPKPKPVWDLVAELRAENARLLALLARAIPVIEQGGRTDDVFHLLTEMRAAITPGVRQ